ncbi:Ribosomal RNA small subunit methyltransferase B [Gammaproteobacteria bacterium]|nr:Ribosomal RNA small subunit methyltransferase B [Gammaproteobacteria bacterium]
MDKSQQLAAQAIGQVFAGRNLTQVLESTWHMQPQLTPQQRAITQDLSYGALRHYGQLQAILAQLLERKLDDERVHHLLLVALYQLVHGKTSEYAVVDHAVKAAAKLKKPWAKGLVNAVLRNFLRRRDALLAKVGEDDVSRYSYPRWWVSRLKAQYPERWESVLEAGNQRPPMTLRVNRRHGTPVEYQARLAEAGIAAHVLGQSAIVVEQPLPVDRLPGFSEGVVSVQDYGAQFAASLLDVRDGMRVLDACCAPGGKTGHILELADVEMTAVDSDADRIARTRSNLVRLGLAADLRIGDAGNPFDWWDGERKFDRILADVPCSASGIVRRHVDIKWLRREQDLRLFATQQAAILRGLWPALEIGGKLLYATCSVFAEENQHQVDAFLQEQSNARQLPLPGLENGQLLPCTEHDGFFYALLEKV